jgi:hypothetical protein
MTTLKDITIEEFIEQNIITDRAIMRKALMMPNSVPDAFLGKPLKPVGIAKFKGDNISIPAWSVDSHFNIGEYYPIYDREGEFAISIKTGEGMKLTPKAWSIKYF